MAKFFLFWFLVLVSLNFHELTNIVCDYGITDYRAVGEKYRCFVENQLDIDSPEKALISSILGTHKKGKSNDDEIVLNIQSKGVKYLPRGLDKIYKKIIGIAVWYDVLNEIHQSDFKPYFYLQYVNIYECEIEILEEGLFEFNPNIIAITFGNAKIFHIDSTVFDNLAKLTSLYLKDNECIDELVEKDRQGVEILVEKIKNQCFSSEFTNLKQKLNDAENSSDIEESFKWFEFEFNVSKFAKFSPLNEKFQKLRNQVTKPKTTANSEASIIDSNCNTQFTKIHELEAKIESLSNKLEEFETRFVEKMENILEKNTQKILKNLNANAI